MRKRFIYDGGKCVQEIVNGEVVWTDPEYSATASGSSATILGDIPDFISPVDGTLVSGRAALREHNKRNDVVNTADLEGLPMKPLVGEYKPSADERQATRNLIAEIMNSKG